MLAVVLAVVASLVSMVSTGRGVVNTGGWPAFGSFWAAALAPELSRDFLAATWDAALVTIAFAVLGTLLALVLGVVFGVLTSETWWANESTSRLRRGCSLLGWVLSRTALSLPRGVHEAVWGLFLVAILGRDPLVGILAIGFPYGAITAKVYSEMIDESARGPYEALRVTGAGRVASLLYAVLPRTLPDLTAYAFYRFECSVRSAVILGMIGAGGLGFELMLSFQGLQYSQMWTLIYARILISALVDRWGATLRRRGSVRRVGMSLLLVVVLIVLSTVHLGVELSRITAESTRTALIEMVGSMWPLRPPPDGWGGLIARSVETVQMSLVAIVMATSLAVLVSVVAARGGQSRGSQAVSFLARMALLVTRAIPPPVWALLVLFVMFPGPLPGAIALGIYNFGILGRLFAETVENLDPAPRDLLTLLGARPVTAFSYATLPMASGQFLSLSLYRWEVATRETVIVGVVGAGGLGRLLEQQRAAFDFGGMAATVLGLIVVSICVDFLSAAIRRSVR